MGDWLLPSAQESSCEFCGSRASGSKFCAQQPFLRPPLSASRHAIAARASGEQSSAALGRALGWPWSQTAATDERVSQEGFQPQLDRLSWQPHLSTTSSTRSRPARYKCTGREVL